MGGWGAGHWVGGWLGEVWGKVSEVKAGRVHPPTPIGQNDPRFPKSFEALKWTEFRHSHGDCSMSFVRYFGEMVLKLGEAGPRLECRVLYLEALVLLFPFDLKIRDMQVKARPQLASNCCRNQFFVLIYRQGRSIKCSELRIFVYICARAAHMHISHVDLTGVSPMCVF